MKLSYTQRLDTKIVIDTEIDGMFNAFETFINLPSMGPINVEEAEINYRHIEHPLRFGPAKEFQHPTITFGVDFSGYRVLNQSIISYNTLLSNAPNIDESNKPVFNAKALVGQSDMTEPGTTDITEIGFGYSTDGGFTWTVIDTTVRPFGRTRGYEPQLYDPITSQPHYMLGVATSYVPFNISTDGAIVLVASFGGAKKNHTSEDITHIGLMTNGNVLGNSGLWGVIEVNGRDNV